MRTLRMWYGLTVIWFERYAKRMIRNLSKKMKVWARKLEYLGDDVTPSWGLKLFHKCYLAETEIHLPGSVHRGYIDAIFQEYIGKKSILVVRLKNVVSQEGFSLPRQIDGIREFKFSDYGEPVLIGDDGYHCVWTGFCGGGYMAIYFSKPQQHRCFN